MDARTPETTEEFVFAPPDSTEEFVFAPPGKQPVPRRLISLLLAFLLVAGVGGFFFVRLSRSAEAQIFRYVFTEGETATYELSMDMSATPKGIPEAPQSLDVGVKATMDLEVVDVANDGTTVLDIRMRNLQVTPAEGPLPADLGTVRVTMAPDGRISKVEGVGGLFSLTGADPSAFFGLPGGGTDAAGSQLFFPQYPTDAIAPGDDWSESSTFPFPFGDEKITLTVDGRHDGFEDTPFGRAARIHHRINFPMDIEFTFTELFEAMLKFAEAFGDGSRPTEPLPAPLQNAKMIFGGNMTMDSDTLVLPDTGDFVQLDGTGVMSLTMKLEGVPQDQLQGQPAEISMDAKFDLSVVRVKSAQQV